MESFSTPFTLPLEAVSSVGLASGQHSMSLSDNIPTSSGMAFDDLAYASPAISQSAANSYFDVDEPCPESPPERPPPEILSIERGNRMLSFQPSTSTSLLLDMARRRFSASMSAQLHGMFFLAESSRNEAGELTSSPPELTCYRRNLFQITGAITLPRMLQYAISENGDRQQLLAQELVISATESVEGSSVKIISVPWKTPISGSTSPAEDKAEKEPSAIPLEQAANSELDADYAIYPFAWKRLQFRVATANNGRRKELQQHFVIKLQVIGTTTTGSRVSLCEALSGPVVVRGRSPRNFSARKDVPLGGCGNSVRRTMSTLSAISPSYRRRSTVDAMLRRVEHSPDQLGYELHAHTAASASRHVSPMSSYDWSPSQPMTAPGSPYTASMTNLPVIGLGISTPASKRKFDDCDFTACDVADQTKDQSSYLALPGSRMPLSRGSAPPPERPHKMMRARGNTVTGIMDPAASFLTASASSSHAADLLLTPPTAPSSTLAAPSATHSAHSMTTPSSISSSPSFAFSTPMAVAPAHLFTNSTDFVKSDAAFDLLNSETVAATSSSLVKPDLQTAAFDFGKDDNSAVDPSLLNDFLHVGSGPEDWLTGSDGLYRMPNFEQTPNLGSMGGLSLGGPMLTRAFYGDDLA